MTFPEPRDVNEWPEGYQDRHGDIWVRTQPGLYSIAGSERHANSLLDSGRVGCRVETIERLYGPLRARIVNDD